MEHVQVAVIGAGQAGLAVALELSGLGVEPVVLERGRIGQTWRDRWESFCLVTPNWFVRLPGSAYDGPEPDGFMPRDEIVAYLERYATGAGVPVREEVEVRSVEPSAGGVRLGTSGGDLRAGAGGISTGAYQRAHPAPRASAPPPPGRVLSVGSGQTGCQIAEELHQAGRDVVVACGRAPWLPRRVGDRDFVWWLVESGFLEATVESLPAPAARLNANVLATGHGGGHDLHLPTTRPRGVTLSGRVLR